MTGTGFAQGIERYSLAGESAYAASAANTSNQPYNLQIGPVTLRVDAGSTLSYNDNITLADTGRQSDWIVTPDLNLHAKWQATELNALTLDLGLSYQHFLSHSVYDGVQIAPNSQTQFNIFIGDVKINLHDIFSYQQNPLEVGQLSNVAQFDVFSNDAGVTADWDLSDIILSLSYDHGSLWAFQQTYSYLNNQSETVTPVVTVNLSKTIQAGVSGSVIDTRFDQRVQNDSVQLTAGPFVTAQISDNLSAQARVGWEYAKYDQGGSNGDQSNISAPSGSAGVTHRINDALQESLTAGREFLPGITSNYTDRVYVNYTPTWHATSLFDIAPEFWWESLQDSYATVHENSTRFGADLAIGFEVTEKMTLNLSYNYVIKNSNEKSMDYYQNLLGLGLKYQF